MSDEAAVKNVTITLDEKTAAWVRVYAARHNTSVSRLVGEMLAQRMRERCEYDDAMRRFLAREPRRIGGAGTTYPSREGLHDRARVR